eukprot:RCo033745
MSTTPSIPDAGSDASSCSGPPAAETTPSQRSSNSEDERVASPQLAPSEGAVTVPAVPSHGGGGREGGKAVWQPDSEALDCNDCKRKFSFTRRRHHCRSCGLIFCHACSRGVSKLPGYRYPVRVCTGCKQRLEQYEQEKWSKWEKVVEYDILLFLGEGAFGKVYRVKHKTTGMEHAMKVIEKSKLRTSQARAAMQGEKLLLQTLSHPYIVRLHRSFQTHDKLFLLMDYLPGGDCYYLMTRLRFPEEVVRIHTAQITLALSYLHSLNIVYRDLKPENCVLDRQGFIVLTDFGLAKEYDDEGYKGSQVGTPDYWAPELFRSEKYNFAVDFWALGCLIYELITGKHPFMDDKGVVTRAKVLHEEPNLRHRSVRISPACEDLVRKLLVKIAGERLQTLAGMKAHPWLQGLDWQKIYDRAVPVSQAWRRPVVTIGGFDPAYTSQKPEIRPSTPTSTREETFQDFTWQEDRSAMFIHQ